MWPQYIINFFHKKNENIPWCRNMEIIHLTIWYLDVSIMRLKIVRKQEKWQQSTSNRIEWCCWFIFIINVESSHNVKNGQSRNSNDNYSIIRKIMFTIRIWCSKNIINFISKSWDYWGLGISLSFHLRMKTDYVYYKIENHSDT